MPALGSRRGEQDRLGVVHLRVAEFHHPLLDAVQLGEGSQFPDVGPDVVGDVVLERHQGPPLPLVTDQGRPVIIPLGPADERKFRVEGQLVAGPVPGEPEWPVLARRVW